MEKLKKISCIILPAAVWAVTVIYMLFLNRAGLAVSSFNEIELVDLIIYIAVQLLIIGSLSVAAVMKFEFKVQFLLWSLLIMYVLFAVFAPPGLYLFTFSGEWSFLWTKYPAMPSWQASFYITLQYGIVILITAGIAQLNKYVKD